MKRFVALHFLPGSCGNFISRCLNLLEKTYVWGKDGVVPITLEEKYKILTYNDRYKDMWSEIERPWVAFEKLIQPYNTIIPSWAIGDDGTAVFIDHPKNAGEIKKIAGANDLAINLYIEPGDYMGWCLLNARQKTSFQLMIWFSKGEALSNDSSVYKINLAEIVNGFDRFLLEFGKLATFLDREVNKEAKVILNNLYEEWYPTTLQGADLEKYRRYQVKLLKKLLYHLDKND